MVRTSPHVLICSGGPDIYCDNYGPCNKEVHVRFLESAALPSGHEPLYLVRCVMRFRVAYVWIDPLGVANTYDFKWVVNLHWWQKNLIQRQWTEELILIVFSYICIESRNSWARSIMWTFFTCSINVALLTYMSWHKGHLRAIIVSNLFSKFYQDVIQYLQTSDQNFTTIFNHLFPPTIPFLSEKGFS
jgi:hypothetical protein